MIWSWLLLFWLLILAGVVFSWILARKTYTRFRSGHSDLFAKLGSPSFLASSRKLRRYLLSDEGHQIADEELQALTKRQTKTGIAIGLAIIVYLLAVLIFFR
jgi:hypothetical protein